MGRHNAAGFFLMREKPILLEVDDQTYARGRGNAVCFSGVSSRSLSEYVADGRLPVARLGGDVLYPLDHLLGLRRVADLRMVRAAQENGRRGGRPKIDCSSGTVATGSPPKASTG